MARSVGVFRRRAHRPPRKRWVPSLAGTVVSFPAARVGQAYRGAGTYPAGELSATDTATIRAQALDGVWETIGTGRLCGVIPEQIVASWSYPWGDEQLRFSLKAARGASRPDLLPFTPVELEIGGRLVWAGRVIDVPSDDTEHQVTAQGWQFHLDDDLFAKAYVLTDLSRWRRRRDHLDTTLGETAVTALGDEQVGGGAIVVSFPDTTVLPAGGTAGVMLDLGPDSRAARVTFAYETSNDNNAAPSMLLDFKAGDAASGAGAVSLNGGPFALTTWGASGSFSATITSPARYLFVNLYNATGGGAHTMVGDAWARITRAIVYAATGYESGGESALLASQVIADALTRAPLLSQSTDLIQTTSFEIPEFAPAGYLTPRAAIEAVNAYEAYQHRIAGIDRRTLEYRPKPTSATVEVGAWSGIQVSDGSVSGQEILNKVIVQGTGPDGEPIVAKVTTGDLDGATYTTLATPQPTNPGFEVNASGWSAVAGSAPTRDTSVKHEGAASGRIDESWVTTTITGLAPGIAYRIRCWLFKTSGYTPDPALFVFDATSGRELATTNATSVPSLGSFEQYELDFVADTASAKFQIDATLIGGVGSESVWVDTVQLFTADRTLPDRRGFGRARTLPISSAITAEVADRLGLLYLAEHVTAPFAASVSVTGNSVRWILGGATIPPWALGDLVGEKLRVNHRVDPDTGARGRDGRIVAVSYSHDARQAAITLDERRDNFARVLAKFDAVVGRR